MMATLENSIAERNCQTLGGGGCKGEVTVTLSTWTPRDTVQDQTPGLGKDPEQGPVIT